MRILCATRFVFLNAVLSGILLADLVTAGVATTDDRIDFNQQIRPILSNNCFPCHGPSEADREADLRLDDRDVAVTEMEVITPGDPEDSTLIDRITSEDEDERMPPADSGKSLTAKQIELLRKWIKQGAKWSEHWSLVAPQRHEIPQQNRPNWGRNEIDAFVLRRLQREELAPSPEADRKTLIRRVTLDLTGLPPTSKEVDDFIADASDQAYEKVVDRLLQSPRYGERMAWPWLDAARYADSNGYQNDADRTMWPWRDWVVEAFNRNLPFDDFTIWQLAGDLLPNPTEEQILATAFCRNHMINGEGGRIPEENRVEYIFDQTETASTVWLGLTMTCARCHDHKYDPVTQRDYYQLFAFFNQTPVTGAGADPKTKPNLLILTSEQKQHLDQLEIHIKKLKQQLSDAPVDKQTKSIQKKIEEQNKKLEEYRRGLPSVMVMKDQPPFRKTFMLTTGLYSQPGAEVSADVPGALPSLPSAAPRNRLALARWLVSPDNPLMSRVTVNRFWAQIFGTGLVKSTEDFGSQGDRPSHPQLLDWLALEFSEKGWNVKAFMRLLVTSATYRQSSKVSPELLQRDPQNRLLARGSRFRMPSWMIRDQALAVSGLLVDKSGGPAVRPYQPQGIWQDVSFGKLKYEQDHGDALYRRSLYTFWRRIIAPVMFFDSATRQTCEVKERRTNTPLHALATLNDVTYVEAARALAQLVLQTTDTNDEQRIQLIYQRALARIPGEVEWPVLLASIARLRDEYGKDTTATERFLSIGESPRDTSLSSAEHAAYAAFCLGVLNLDETLNKE